MSMKKMLAVVAAASLVAVAAPAFAANPFTDVPLNHWAYDAVEELSAKGILEGYPNGAFRGNRPMTRYEIACMVARLMNVGLTGADLERLKSLVVEFQPELENLGVKVDALDSRVASLEKGLKGWRISGEMQFDYNSFGDKFDNLSALGLESPTKHGFDFDSARLFLHRDMDNGLSFDAEYGDGALDRYYLTAEDFLGVEGLSVRFGQFDIDYEGDDGLYYDEHEDAGFLMGYTYGGAQVSKTFGLAELSAFAASSMRDDGISVYGGNEGGEYYGARLKFDFNEKAWLSGNFYTAKPGADAEVAVGEFKAYWVGAGYNIADGIELKGAYYWEDITEASIDDPNAWKLILNVDQDVLKFTSLWVEYAQFDKGFVCESAPYAFHSFTSDMLSGDVAPIPEDTDVLFVALKQEWTEKWSTFERYHHYDIDSYGKVKEWAVGVGYQYTPDVYFELAYDQIDVGDFNYPGFDDEGIIRFRTLFTF